MIVGNGMIAGRFYAEFAGDTRFIIFASGVSDSKLNDPQAFGREERLLRQTIEQNPGKTLVYFSTCSIYDPGLDNMPYTWHKRNMEKIIHETANQYFICRTTNLVGETKNKSTIINYLVEKIRNRQYFICWKGAVRNILDIEDFYKVIKELLLKMPPDDKKTINIFNPVFYEIENIIEVIENHLSIRAKYIIEKKGSAFRIPGLGDIDPVYKMLGLKFNADYLDRVLARYFPVPVTILENMEK